MSKSTARRSRREAARLEQRRGSGARWLIPAVAILIVGAAGMAILFGQSSAGAAASPSAAPLTGPPEIAGSSLPVFIPSAKDPAVGAQAPTVQGHDDEGQPVSIEPTGRPMLVIFAAHWCRHCQRELPTIQAWIDAGGVPPNVDLRTVSTAIDPTLPNYPPKAWFDRMSWSVPVIVDPSNTVAAAYGLSAYPFFVLLDGDGRVVTRLTGEIPVDQLRSLLTSAPAS
jgi:thiol-disulfide isomerase/thioredoxin